VSTAHAVPDECEISAAVCASDVMAITKMRFLAECCRRYAPAWPPS